ncbi:MAG TPA: 3-isopropylmalate dehydratase small subunit [Kofleriaceae bacterium]
MTPFTTLTARAVVLRADDVDTDQIIPARFLKGTSKTGLAAHLFADWRTQPGFPLLQSPDAADAQILVTGVNFGCGSSREHAPWALVDWGFRAIIARSFADIFKENSAKNGLLTIALPDEACTQIERAVQANAGTQIHIELANERVTLPDGTSFQFEIDPFAKHCLASGLDELGYILSFGDQITAHEQR